MFLKYLVFCLKAVVNLICDLVLDLLLYSLLWPEPNLSSPPDVSMELACIMT